jgi:hypothetical protein
MGIAVRDNFERTQKETDNSESIDRARKSQLVASNSQNVRVAWCYPQLPFLVYLAGEETVVDNIRE